MALHLAHRGEDCQEAVPKKAKKPRITQRDPKTISLVDSHKAARRGDGVGMGKGPLGFDRDAGSITYPDSIVRFPHFAAKTMPSSF